MSTAMRGLTTFIADLRNCRAKEQEEKRINKELANIRSKFKEGSLNGYQKRKYVCKLLYIYILGYEVEFGHVEAISLISSSKYSEKQVGYLACTLLLGENSEMIRLVINSIRKDLEDSNEINVCLALHCIANVGAREMAESLAIDVERVMVASSRAFVRKKAALTLLRLFRKHGDLMPVLDWVDQICPLIADENLGVATSVASLLTAFSQQYSDQYSKVVPRAIEKLYKIVIDRDFSPDYVYYKVPAPWLQVKILRLLQYYPPPIEGSHVRNKLTSAVNAIITNSLDIPKNPQHSNAQNAVLFEAINMAIELDPESPTVVMAAELLGKFISSKETNVRFLALETMCHLAGMSDLGLDDIKKQQDVILQSLKDRDISVRRRALDLLYSMCDSSNAKVIVAELLKFLPIAEHAIKEEVALKVAILAEKWAEEYSWFLDVVISLIGVGGDYVGDDVWYRVVQIVINNEDLQEYAAKTVIHSLRSPTCHETNVKVGGYVLGEFGHLVANLPGCSPIEQFTILHSKFANVSLPTRALLLTTYLKMVNLFPEIKGEIVKVFQQWSGVLDVELQQRACEYLAITQMPTDDLLQTVCDEMPPFPERESALITRLHKKILDTEDKRTWAIGGKDVNREIRQRTQRKRALSSSAPPSADAPLLPGLGTPPAAAPKTSNNNDLLGLGGLDGLIAKPVAAPPNPSSSIPVAPIEAFYNKLVLGTNGVLYEDGNLQVGLKTEYQSHMGRIALYIGNKTQSNISAFTIELRSVPALRFNLVQPISANVIPPQTQFQQMYTCEANGVFSDPPLLTLNYTINGASFRHDLKVPVTANKFFEGISLGSQDFFNRWRQIGGPPRESQIIFKNPGPIDLDATKQVLTGLRWQILDGVDPSPNNFVAAGILSTVAAGKVGCLLRLEPNMDQQMFRLTLRSTNELATETLKGLIQTYLTTAV
ncbi:putative AP-2 adaptor complex subunit alpha [Gonapodya prolifera JEL478]|uniref:AP-2 complex subunit alpha n=1 Tax=Gonapodya prolifera (strain JEL478) TaxID=1344416 RepID=A0A139AH38_GONPJ|nr:putative AP-2 adaptor complex subunit alpha [Gonapodya prolifera JEL478]|eukprot:KXS16070.1 putative AP-2 adaptor complex subunit alpha [Gonapodya prolifera JEL478]